MVQKKRPYYHIVAANVTSPRDGRYIERVGSYNPMVEKDHPQRVVLEVERIKYWLSNGAHPTDRVAKILGANKVIAMPGVRQTPKKSLPKEKAIERAKEREEKIAAAKEAAAEAEAAKKAEAEAAKNAAKEAATKAEEAPKAEAAPKAEEAPKAEAAPKADDSVVDAPKDAEAK